MEGNNSETQRAEQIVPADAALTRSSLRVFISHSHLDRVHAATIKQVWELYGMDVVVAHEDLTPSAEWEREIHKFIRTADLFIPVLTENFRNSEWTDQETGIAYEKEIEFFPVIVTRLPYGFIGKYHGTNCTAGVTRERAIEMIDELLRNEHIKSRLLDSIIRALDASPSYDWTRELIEKIRVCMDVLDSKRINAICRSWLTHMQVQNEFRARYLIREFLKERKENIDPKLLPDLERVVQEQDAPLRTRQRAAFTQSRAK